MAQVNAVGVYDWKPIYQELATALLRYRHDRSALVEELLRLEVSHPSFGIICEDRFGDGRRGPPEDMCPMTVFASFNRGIKRVTRIEMIGALKRLVEVSAPVPTEFDGIPILHNQQSWLFPFAYHREADHVDALWRLWEAAISLADSGETARTSEFVAAFDNAFGRRCSSWGVTAALFWARPDYFVPLDGRSRATLAAAGYEIGTDGPNGRVSGENYLAICGAVRGGMGAGTAPWSSIAEMSHGAYLRDARGGGSDSDADDANEAVRPGKGRVWLVAAGSGGREWKTWQERGIVSVSVEDIDLSEFASKSEILDALVSMREGDQLPKHDATACWEFLKVMQPGDEVFVKSGRSTILGYGRVTGSYRFEERQGYCHERSAHWESVSEVRIPESSNLLVTKTLTDITNDKSLLKMLRSLVPAAAATEARTFLFTWNPERWGWPELEDWAAILTRGGTLPEDKWSTGPRRDMRAGDRFFVLRQGAAPRGIVGAGRVLGPPVEQPHWDEARAEAGETSLSAPIAFETLVPREELLTVEALQAAGLDGVRWNPQSSGTQIPAEHVSRVEAAWKAHLSSRLQVSTTPSAARAPYGLDELEQEGCFVPRARVEAIVERLVGKKNLILQGPPGTGKTWLAKRLGDILVGYRNSGRVRVVQFHPNVSYEDFVRGYRPGSDGQLRIVDGLFMEAVKAAKARPAVPMVVVIEEINRGNPAQVFGELLTLLESSKRNPESAIELTYASPEAEQADGSRGVHLPENLYVIGTMNTADRSIAMVDIAFRRRFSFENLRPSLDEAWLAFVQERGLTRAFANRIRSAVDALNDVIKEARTLGADYCLGHSFFTPHERLDAEAAQKWIDGVIEAEVAPLLQEYWFDDPESVKRTVAALREALR